MKISLVGSYALADGYLGAAKSLRKLGIEVDFVPAQKYRSENPSEHLNLVCNDLLQQKPDVVLWWRAETLDGNQFSILREKIPGKFIMYSWDDPYQWERHHEMPQKCPYLDVAFSCCEGSIAGYKRYGAKNAVYCLPGFDPEVHFPEEDDRYKCDISLVCTNLYHGDSITRKNHISRLDLMNYIIQSFPMLDIRIYGSENMRDAFGERYKGWISFNESRKVFYNSKINISTHIRPDGFKYLNERVGQIMGSGGLLLCDRVNGIDNIFRTYSTGGAIDSRCECAVFENIDEKLLYTINDIMDNNDFRKSIASSGFLKAIKDHTWDNWARTMLKEI